MIGFFSCVLAMYMNCETFYIPDTCTIAKPVDMQS
jgi:hypothetical protein